MKLLALLLFSASLTLTNAQTMAELRTIFKENDKYGVFAQNYSFADARILIAPKYDTLYWLNTWSYDTYMIGIIGNQTDIIEFNADRTGYNLLDTLGINHVFELATDDYQNDMIGSNSKGDLYLLYQDYQPYKTDQTIIIRKSDQLYYLVKKKKNLIDKGFNRIYPEGEFFACYADDGILFYDSEGNQLYDELVDTYAYRKTEENEWVSVAKGNKRGFFSMSGTNSPLITVTTPEAIIIPDQYEGSRWDYPLPTVRVFTESGKYGLADGEGKQLWPAEKGQIVVWRNNDIDFVIVQKKKKLWELYTYVDELELLAEHEFDEVLGYNNDVLFVRKEGDIYCIHPDDLEIVDPIESYEFNWSHLLIMNPEGKIGAIDPTGRLIIPCVHEHLSDETPGIIELNSNAGKIAFSTLGDTVSPVPYDVCYPFEYTDGAYCYRKGMYWGIFTTNNNGSLVPTSFYKPYNQVNFDVIAHSHLADAYVFVENNKVGLISKYGEVLHTAEYDSIIHETSRNQHSMYLGKKGGETFVFSADGKNKLRVPEGLFIEFSEDWGYIFATKDSLKCINPKTLENMDYFDPDFPAHQIVPYGYYPNDYCVQGVVNTEGKFIIPMQYPHINIEQYGEEAHHAILVRDSSGHSAFYTIEGKAMTTFEFNSISQPCDRLNQMFFFKHKDGSGYLASWNAKEELLTPFSTEDVTDVSCNYRYKEGDHLAIITYLDGKKGYLYADLRIELIR